MRHLLSQALEHDFPAAPHFEAEVKTSSLKKVFELILPATQQTDGRLLIEKTLRPLVRQIAEPLMLGEMGADATHFLIGQFWKNHFGRKAAEAGGELTVGQLRRWIDDPRPMGLSKEAQNVVILLYAAQTSQTLYRHGGPDAEASLSSVSDVCVLRKDKLPDAADWELALKLAGSILGVAGLRLLSAGNVTTLSTDCQRKAKETRRACQSYAQGLRQRSLDMGMAVEASERLKTADAAQRLLDRISSAELAAVVSTLASAAIATSETAMGECIAKAAQLEAHVDPARWQTFELIRRLPPEHQTTAQQILDDLKTALASDEHVLELAPALTKAQAQSMRLLQKVVETQPSDKPTGAVQPPVQPPAMLPPSVQPPSVQPPSVQPSSGSQRRIVSQDAKQNIALPAARELLSELSGKLKPGQSVRVSVTWVVEEGGDA
ncbi:MAG TPA: hypothetical protein DIT89_13755 [Planctomycetaceae bacterium]|nr:hypothetical protein [Planctomycetaceae bacterium]